MCCFVWGSHIQQETCARVKCETVVYLVSRNALNFKFCRVNSAHCLQGSISIGWRRYWYSIGIPCLDILILNFLEELVQAVGLLAFEWFIASWPQHATSTACTSTVFHAKNWNKVANKEDDFCQDSLTITTNFSKQNILNPTTLIDSSSDRCWYSGNSQVNDDENRQPQWIWH